MRYRTDLVLALALSVMGCSETSGTGGSAGEGGMGGFGGDGGGAGMGGGGVGGEGGDAGGGGNNSAVFPCTEEGIRDAVALGGGPHTFDCDGPTTVVTGAVIIIDNDVILDGEGSLTVDAGGDDNGYAFEVHGTAELRRLTVTNNARQQLDGPFGGCIIVLESGALTLTQSTVKDCVCSPPDRSGDCFAGLFNGGGTASLVNSTVPFIAGWDKLWLLHATVVGGVEWLVGGMTASSSIVGRCLSYDTSHVSLGYNIESPGNTCGFDQPSDQVNISAEDLALGPLADNGGPTETHALGAGSFAIDQIPPEDCVDADGEPLTTDQRGVERPQELWCDVGAVEFEMEGPGETCTLPRGGCGEGW